MIFQMKGVEVRVVRSQHIQTRNTTRLVKRCLLHVTRHLLDLSKRSRQAEKVGLFELKGQWWCDPLPAK